MRQGNLFLDSTPPPTGERFDTLLQQRNLVIERICSSASPLPREYRQTQDEWVLLVRGEATLEVDGNAHRLTAGDYRFLPANTPHRVAEVSDGALWLAIHLHPEPPSRDATADG